MNWRAVLVFLLGAGWVGLVAAVVQMVGDDGWDWAEVAIRAAMGGAGSQGS